MQMNTAEDTQNLKYANLQACMKRQTHTVTHLIALMLPLLLITGEVRTSVGLSCCRLSAESVIILRSQKQSPYRLQFSRSFT